MKVGRLNSLMGCAGSSSVSTHQQNHGRLRRVGNFTFSQHGTPYLDRIFVGDGCKKTPGWSTSSTKEEVELKIQEFWETRVNNNPEAWKLLRLACSMTEPQEAAAMCQAGGLQLINGSLLCSQDEAGLLYELPPYVLNPAIKYGIGAPKVSEVSGPGIKLTVKLRSIKFSDVDFDCSTLTTGLEVKEFCATKHNLSKMKLRCFYAGRELKDDARLQQIGVKDHEILTVLVSG